jgi:hypothetical protein
MVRRNRRQHQAPVLRRPTAWGDQDAAGRRAGGDSGRGAGEGMKCAAVAFAIVALGAGLLAAYFWFKAGRVAPESGH